jgi:hypothetical protein
VIIKEINSIVLRRRSWPIFFGIAITGLGIGVVMAVLKVTSLHGFRTGWQGIPVYLAAVAILGRIVNCKVILREKMLVVNPLRTHIIPRRMVDDVVIEDDGTLEIHTGAGRKVAAFAFGGSLVDRVSGTSLRAKGDIGSWMNSGHVEKGEPEGVQVLWSRCPWADVSLLLCVVTAVVGGLWMILSG